MKCQISVSAPNRKNTPNLWFGVRLSRNYSFADNRNGPWAVPKSSESSYTETFSLQKFKNGDTCSPFFEHLQSNAILCALPRAKY